LKKQTKIKMTEIKKTILIAITLACLATACFASIVYSNNTKSEAINEMEQSPPVRSFYVSGHGNEKTTIDVIKIDGVEYLVAYTPRGVSICKK
tara:strand:- start:3724 stop:4002 length:279 start_codon:yes stop_codon:yes gene_type:complete